MKFTSIFWFTKFRSGDFGLKNKPRGRPKPKVNNDVLKAFVERETQLKLLVSKHRNLVLLARLYWLLVIKINPQ